MKPLDLRTRRLVGVGFILLALILALFLWFVAGPRALIVGSVSPIVLIAFGSLFLSGRWPPARQDKEKQ